MNISSEYVTDISQKNNSTIVSDQRPQTIDTLLFSTLVRLRTKGIFELKIIALGNIGAGKSATINSILNEKNASMVGALTSNTTDTVTPFSRALKSFNLLLIDTPGLLGKDSSSNISLNK